MMASISTGPVPKPSRLLLQKLAENADPPSLSEGARGALLATFAALVDEAHDRRLHDDVWLVLVAAALISANVPSGFSAPWTFVRRHHVEDLPALFRCASHLRETILKTMALSGAPRVIIGLTALTGQIARLDPVVFDLLRTQAPRRQLTSRSADAIVRRGHDLWISEHRPYDQQIVKKLASLHPDLPHILIETNYGALEADPPDSEGPAYAAPVGRICTSLLAVAALRAVGGQGPQLVGHALGVMKTGIEAASGTIDGATEVGEGWQWLTGSAGMIWVLDVVDRIMWAARQSGEADGRAFTAKL